MLIVLAPTTRHPRSGRETITLAPRRLRYGTTRHVLSSARDQRDIGRVGPRLVSGDLRSSARGEGVDRMGRPADPTSAVMPTHHGG
jgi:hypothetical protein